MLAECSETHDNTTVTRLLLTKIPPQDGKMTYVYGKSTTFHYVVEAGITYLCMTSEMEKRRIPFSFLEDVRQRFRATYGSSADHAPAFSLNADFAPVLSERMALFNQAASGGPQPGGGDPNLGSVDKLSSVKAELDEVKGVMVENIERVMERGERLELLVDKSEQLNQASYKFERSSRSLKNALFWQRMKLYAGVASAVLLAGGVGAASFCGGPTFAGCGA